MDPDGPRSRAERTFWTILSYITGAVTRLFRPESANPVQENRAGTDLGHREDDSHGGGVTEEPCKLTTTSVVGSSRPAVTWEGCNTDMNLQPDEIREEPSNQSENEDTVAKKDDSNEGSMKDGAEAMIPQEIDEAINDFQVKKEDDGKQSENEPQDFKMPHPLCRLEDEDHTVKPCTTTDLYGEEEDNIHTEDAAATGGTYVTENTDGMLQMTAENGNSFNVGLEPGAINLFSVSVDKQDVADLMFSENLLQDESLAGLNKNNIVLSDEIVGLEQEPVMADGSDKSDNHEEVEGESTVTDGEECPTTHDHDAPEHVTCRETQLLNVAKDVALKTKTKADQTEHRITIKEKSSERLAEMNLDPLDEWTFSSEDKESDVKNAFTTSTVTETAEGLSAQEGENVPLLICEGQTVVHQELNSAARQETPEGLSGYNNKPELSENLSQWFMEAGDYEENPITQMPEELESKEPESAQSSTEAEDLLMRNHTEEEHNAECGGTVQLTDSEAPLERQKLVHDPPTQGSLLYFEDVAQFPSDSMKMEVQNSEEESVDQTDKELQDKNEETLVEFEINVDLRESTGDDAAETVDEGHENTRTEAAAGFSDGTMKYTLDKVILDVTESGLLMQSETKMHEDGAGGLQSVPTETQAATIDVAEIDGGIEEESENETKMEILETSTADAPVPSLETETQQSSERAESWDEDIPSDTVAADEMMITGQSGSNEPSFKSKEITHYVWESEGATAGEAENSNVGNENVTEDKILDLWLETLSEDTEGDKPELLEWSETEQQPEGQDETSSAKTEEKEQLVESESSGESGLASDTETSTELGCLEDSSSDWYVPNYDTQFPKSAGEVFQGTCVMSNSADVPGLSTNQSELQHVLIKDAAEDVQLNIKGNKSVNEAGFHSDLEINLSDDQVPNQLYEGKTQVEVNIDVEIRSEQLERSEPEQHTDVEMDASNEGRDETSSLETDEKDHLLESESSGESGYNKSRIVPHDDLVDLEQDHMMADKSEVLHEYSDDQEEMKSESRVSEEEEGPASQKETVTDVMKTANNRMEQSDNITADFSAEDGFTSMKVDRMQDDSLSSEDIKNSHPATTVTETAEGSSAHEGENVPLQICEGQSVVHQELNSAACQETPEGLPGYNNKPKLSEDMAQWFLEAGYYEENPTTQMPEELESKEPESVQSSTEAEDLLMRNHTEEEHNAECGGTVQLTDNEAPLERQKLNHDPPTQGLLLYFEDVAQFPSDSMKMEVQNSEEESVDQTDKELQDKNEETLVELKTDGGLCESTGDDATQTVDEGHENTRTEAAAGFSDGTMKYTIDKVILDLTDSGFVMQSETKIHEDGAGGLQIVATEMQEATIDVAGIDGGIEEDSVNETKMEISETSTAEAPVLSLETETQQSSERDESWDEDIPSDTADETLSEDTDGVKPELLEQSECEQQSDGEGEASTAKVEDVVESDSSGESGLASDTETSDKEDEEEAKMHISIDPEVRTEQKETEETILKAEQTQPRDDPSTETEQSDIDQMHETEKNVHMLSGSDVLFKEQPACVESLKTFPAVDKSQLEWSEEKQWMIKSDKDEVDAPALDFTAQRSKIAVKNPHVRPPRNPRALLQMPSVCPTPSKPPAAKVLVGVPMEGLGIGIKLPGLGEGFPILKKTQKRMRDENLDISPQETEAKPEEKSDAPQEDEAPPKPKWMPPRHPGFGNPLLSELKTKLKKTTKE
ncbi:uncharacterized protein si:ch211-136m16.8 isoform X2 [Thalassophryne amazonica]|uniref:uncharacterized protein si:ch211-136m16.8 isoform X2 n=1 Tax=Thalassophryne amazonica TaxID=390379 RepID=UPI001470E20D|nr:uncharacterized protein si:ch211-136m16.8 isoform X2 [Thalassophryne amazonica]